MIAVRGLYISESPFKQPHSRSQRSFSILMYVKQDCPYLSLEFNWFLHLIFIGTKRILYPAVYKDRMVTNTCQRFVNFYRARKTDCC